MMAMRDHDGAASALGADPRLLTLKAFALSSGMAGLAGALYVYLAPGATPESFGLDFAIAFLAMIVIGGLGSPTGALIGAALWRLGAPVRHRLGGASRRDQPVRPLDRRAFDAPDRGDVRTGGDPRLARRAGRPGGAPAPLGGETRGEPAAAGSFVAADAFPRRGRAGRLSFAWPRAA